MANFSRSLLTRSKRSLREQCSNMHSPHASTRHTRRLTRTLTGPCLFTAQEHCVQHRRVSDRQGSRTAQAQRSHAPVVNDLALEGHVAIVLLADVLRAAVRLVLGGRALVEHPLVQLQQTTFHTCLQHLTLYRLNSNTVSFLLYLRDLLESSECRESRAQVSHPFLSTCPIGSHSASSARRSGWRDFAFVRVRYRLLEPVFEYQPTHNTLYYG